MIIAAYDIGLRLGYCIGAIGDKEPRTGAIVVQDGKHPGARFADFHKQISKVFDMFDAEAVAFEDVKAHPGAKDKVKGFRSNNVGAAHLWGAFHAEILHQSFRLDLPVIPIGVGTAKKAATGKGNSEKLQVFLAIRKQFPNSDIAGFDESDAVSIWLAACSQVLRNVAPDA